MLHTSDCHLGTGFPGPEEAAFRAAIDLALAESVDVFLIAGDLFDGARLPDEVLEWASREVDRLPCTVIAIPGNHDALVEKSIFERFASRRNSRTIVFDDPNGAIKTVPGTNIAVWGRALTHHSPSYRPLQGLPKRPDNEVCIALAHGLVQEDERHSGRSSPILPSELTAFDWDYLALGHCHRRRRIADCPVPAFYSGATADSMDGEPTVLLVDFLDQGAPIVAAASLGPYLCPDGVVD